MERMVSSFSVTGRAREEPPAGSVDDPTLDLAMAEMEREFDGMNPDNPDPRQVARMLRKLTKASGEAMPEQMEEMMRRLEGGEALEKLEAEFGDLTDAVGAQPSDDDALTRSGEVQKIKERLRAARQRPVRDPVMYEMAEYATLPVEPALRVKRRGNRKTPR